MRKGKLLALRRVNGTTADLSDHALVAACAVGESAALGALFDRYHLDVYRFLRRLAGTDDRDLDDLVQATFLEISRSASRFGGTGAVKTWIFGIANNIARHHVRGEIRRKGLAARYAEWPSGASPALDDVAAARQLLSRMGDALAALPHDLRAVFVLCDLEDVPGAEAARVLGLREGTLWRRLHNARKRLRQLLEGTRP